MPAAKILIVSTEAMVNSLEADAKEIYWNIFFIIFLLKPSVKLLLLVFGKNKNYPMKVDAFFKLVKYDAFLFKDRRFDYDSMSFLRTV